MPIRGGRAFVIGLSAAVSAAAFCLGARVVPSLLDSAMTLGILSALISVGYSAAEISQYRGKGFARQNGIAAFPPPRDR